MRHVSTIVEVCVANVRRANLEQEFDCLLSACGGTVPRILVAR